MGHYRIIEISYGGQKKGFSVIKIFEVLVLFMFAKASESEVT